MNVPSNDDPVQAARALAPLIESVRNAGERDRRLPVEAAHAMADAGLFRLWVPKALGGREVDVATLIRVVEEVSRSDAAAGWCLTVIATYGRIGGYLPREVAVQIFDHPRAALAGVINPSGAAVSVPGGFRVSGRWSFGSGIEHCQWVFGNCVVGEGDVRSAFFPKSACQVLDTWHVGGLRGTGSHDFVVSDLVVPNERVIPAFSAKPTVPGTLYALPLITVFAVSIAAVPLGIARAAIDTVVDLATVKTPTGSSALLRQRPSVQADVGRAEALIRSARAYLFEAVGEMWDAVERGSEATMSLRANVRLACAHAAQSCVRAVDMMYDAGGATSLRQACRLEGCLRDVHAAAQHIAVVANNFELAGRVLLGLDPGTARF